MLCCHIYLILIIYISYLFLFSYFLFASLLSFLFFFFFFQAEDGIRDVAVTGVQTCALPIYGAGLPEVEDVAGVAGFAAAGAAAFFFAAASAAAVSFASTSAASVGEKIGRASCRERV